MLILLPPSEGKTAPRRGATVSPSTWPEDLRDSRRHMFDALRELCLGDPESAAATLGLGVSQLGEVARNAALDDAATGRADRVYSGVLYEALDFATLSTSAKRRANGRIAITSSLYGLVRPHEPIAAYRLSGDVTLPQVGKVAAFWRDRLDPVLHRMAGSGLVVDLRSSTYAGFWKPTPERARKVVTIRVLHEANGTLKVVSHFNKATKGRLVRALLEDGRDPASVRGFVELLTSLGWDVRGDGNQLDIVVTEV